MAILLLHGDDRYTIDSEARAWLRAAREGAASELNVEVFDAPARLDQVRRSLAEVPFLDERRRILISDPPQLAERGRRGADGADALASALASRAPTSDVCLVGHQRVAPTNPVLQAVRGEGGQIREHSTPRGRDLRAWLDQRLREHGLRLSRDGVDHLVRVAGGDLGLLVGEVAKLAAYAAGRAAVPTDVVRLLAGGDEQLAVWGVLERLLSPGPGRGAAALDTLLSDGVSSQYLISTLSGQLRELLQAQEILAAGGGAGRLASALKIPPWRAERLARQSQTVSAETVEAWLRALQRLDADIKLGRAGDADGLRTFGLRAARDVAAGRRPNGGDGARATAAQPSPADFPERLRG